MTYRPKPPLPPKPPLKLPTVMPGNKRTKGHPLLWVISNMLPEPETKSDLALYMGIRPQSLYKWLAACRIDRNFSIPAERAIQIARYFDVPVGLFRPDLEPK